MANLIAALVNLLTLIATTVVSVLKRNEYEKEAAVQKAQLERLHENPGKHLADMFGTRNADGLRSDSAANTELHHTRSADPTIPRS